MKDKFEEALWNVDEEGNYMRRAELKLDSDIVSKTEQLRKVSAYWAKEAGREIRANAQAAVRGGASVDSLL